MERWKDWWKDEVDRCSRPLYKWQDVSDKIVSHPINLWEIKEYNLYLDLIRNILVNEEKRLVTVVFRDGGHEIVKCSENDEFDVKIGVALAICQHLYGSKNRFHKEIEKKVKYKEGKKCKKN